MRRAERVAAPRRCHALHAASSRHRGANAQIREEEVADGTVGGEDVDGIRMTMFYYAQDLNNYSSGHFSWNYSEADKCHKPFGGPTWCMTENMANATYRGFNYPHQVRAAASRLAHPPPRPSPHPHLARPRRR